MKTKTDKLKCGLCLSEGGLEKVDQIRTVTVWAVKCKNKRCRQEGPRFGFLVTGNSAENDRLAKAEAVKGWKKINTSGTN